jgi:hypothetical protein
MKNYDHLTTNAMRSRYVLAADHVKGESSILEIGGTQMWEVLPWNFHQSNCDKTVDCIDPCAGKAPLVKGVTYHNTTVQEFDMKGYLKHNKARTKAAVFIGIEMEISRDDIFSLAEDLLQFDMVILDHVMSNKTADCQASIMANALKYGGFNLKVELLIAARYDHEYMSTRDEYTPSLFKNRLFQVFVKK